MAHPLRAPAAKQQDSPDTTPVPKLHARKQELVRYAIWDAAIDLFAERGFDETTVDEIAEAAGVSQRTFFRYFDSKADLMANSAVNLAIALSEAIRDCPANYSHVEVMRAAVLSVLRQAAAYPRLEKIIQIASRYPAAKQAQASRTPELQAEVAQAYQRRIKHPRKGDITPKILAAITTSLFDVALHTWLEASRGSIETAVDEAIRTTQQVLR